MKVLVIGSGGREHALVWKIAQSPLVTKVYCAPGNAGMARDAECVTINATDIESLKEFALDKGIDLTVVGPELPLTLGIVDVFEDFGLRIFGPSRKAAELEGSKVLAKNLMAKYSIPTAEYMVFDNLDEARDYVKTIELPVVIKADGLAGGKGAVVCNSLEEALKTLKLVMEEKVFGKAGNRVIIEEFLKGEEASFIVITDGTSLVTFPSSQDHKAVYDGDRGPNTGGMGAYSPAPVVTDEMEERIKREIILPVIKAMENEGRDYYGFLYAGLMITDEGPKVLEFNCRMGDPEAQPLLMRMKSDIVPLLEATLEKRLGDIHVEWENKAALCVVMASGGYPGRYEMGKEIRGIDEASNLKDVMIFHGGTSLKDGRFITSGGRVLGVTALGSDIKEAIEKAYEAVERISWEGVHYRRDIGAKAIGD